MILIPAAAIGNNPTGVKTEYLPPTSLGTTKVSYPFVSANFLKAPLLLSVVAKILCLASSLPTFCSSSVFRCLKVNAGSVVVPDFEITLIEKFLVSKYSVNSFK